MGTPNNPPQTSATTTPNKAKVLFADVAVLKFKSIIERLEKDGVLGEAVTDGVEFLNKISENHYDVGVINLLLGGIGPYELIRQVRTRSKNPDIKIMVISKQVHKVNIQNTIQAGATDFVGEPFENEALYLRVLYHLAPKQEIELEKFEKPVTANTTHNLGYMNLLLDASEILANTPRTEAHAALQKILEGIAKLVPSNRTSLIIVEPETNNGVVLATSDDPLFHDFPISLTKYPEIQHVINTGKLVCIGDVTQNAMTKSIAASVRTIKIGSLMVFPVSDHGELVGVLNVRMGEGGKVPPADELRILQAVATTMAAHTNIRATLRRIYKDFTKPPTAA